MWKELSTNAKTFEDHLDFNASLRDLKVVTSPDMNQFSRRAVMKHDPSMDKVQDKTMRCKISGTIMPEETPFHRSII